MAMQLNVVNPSTAAVPATTKKPKELYLNPGYHVEIGGKTTFVGLPWGLMCDDMPEVKVEGSNPDYIALCEEKNNFRKLIMDAFEKLAPGEEHIIDNLVIQIRRNKGPAVVVEPQAVVGSLLKLNFANKKG
jgi:hypothetical protein